MNLIRSETCEVITDRKITRLLHSEDYSVNAFIGIKEKEGSGKQKFILSSWVSIGNNIFNLPIIDATHISYSDKMKLMDEYEANLISGIPLYQSIVDSFKGIQEKTAQMETLEEEEEEEDEEEEEEEDEYDEYGDLKKQYDDRYEHGTYWDL